MYIIISTQIRYENGPTRCGDEFSDAQLMSSLGAVLTEGKTFTISWKIRDSTFVLEELKTK